MRKAKTLNQVVENGVVAVIRGKSKEQGLGICKASVAGDLKSLEVAYTTPKASEIIAELKDFYVDDPTVVVGAGTVLDAVTARLAIESGADFIVSPAFDAEVAVMCNLYQIPYMPGCMTITEVLTAMEAGSDIVKIFPADLFGPAIIKDIKGPLPHAKMMPTGGVDVDNVDQWIKAGAVAVGAGSSLTKGAKTGDYAAITETAKLFIARIKEARGK